MGNSCVTTPDLDEKMSDIEKLGKAHWVSQCELFFGSFISFSLEVILNFDLKNATWFSQGNFVVCKDFWRGKKSCFCDKLFLKRSFGFVFCEKYIFFTGERVKFQTKLEINDSRILFTIFLNPFAAEDLDFRPIRVNPFAACEKLFPLIGRKSRSSAAKGLTLPLRRLLMCVRRKMFPECEAKKFQPAQFFFCGLIENRFLYFILDFP